MKERGRAMDASALGAWQALLADETTTTEQLEEALRVLTAAVGKADENLAADRAAKEAARKAAEAAAAAAREKAMKAALAKPSAEAVEKAILAQKSDTDPAGSAFAPLMLSSKKQTKNSNTLKWQSVPGASGYVVYGSKCGKANKIKRIALVKGTSFKHKKLKKGTYYKYVVVAVEDTVAGQRVDAISKMIHVATKGGKAGNYKGVTVKAKVGKKTKKLGALALKKGKSAKLKVTLVPSSKKLKVGKHVNVRFESSAPQIAAVSAKGVVKAKGKGTCYVYAYAQDGVCKKVKVAVK